MARSITDARQVTLRAFLQQIANAASYAGTADSKPANQSELDNLLSSLNAEVTPLLRMSASSTPDLVVTVGAGKLTNSESSYTRAIPHVGTAYVQFASGTLTFPASSGGNIVASPGNPSVLTLGVGNYAAVLIYLDGNGNLNTIVGAEDAVEATAITNLPPSPDSTLPIGYVVVHNTAGVIDAIIQTKISQFGTGAGGGGSGDASLAEVALRDRFAQSGFKYLDPNIFKRDKDTKVDGASTGVFDLVKSAFKLTSIGQTFVSTNLANSEFLAEGVDITEIELITYWLLSFVDSAATYEASRDGGTNWTTLDMERVGTDSNAFRGYQVFEDESVQQSLAAVAASGAGTALNATTAQELSSELAISTTSVIRSIDLELNYGGAGVGNLYVRIVRDDSGSPSTDLEDLISESNAVSIEDLSSGDITLTVDIPQAVLTAGAYHIVLATDSGYKAGTLDLSWRNGAGTDGAAYDGSVWTAGASTKAYEAFGRAHDLRIRITGSATNRYIEAIGVNFGSDDGILAPNGSKNVQRFYFTGDENRTEFALNWTPDPDILEMYDVYRGQVYVIDNDTVRISGQTVIFDPDTFDFPGEDILLIARQIKGIGIDNSDSNAAAISEQASNLLDLGVQTSELDYVAIPTMAVANSTITNRAAMPDLSQDLGVMFGPNRLMTQWLFPLPNEMGTGARQVFGVSNDRFNQMRFVGQWTNQQAIDGAVVVTTTADDYIEVTFYGTGLNMMVKADGARDLRASVDGGGEGGDFTPTASTILTGRNYSSNMLMNVATGLSLGIHTVKIRHVSGNAVVSGFEVVNDDLIVNPGSQYVAGKKRTLATQQSLTYNSSFETGVLGTRGGRALVYQKSDGTIAKAVIPTDASQLNLTSANHANEEIARIFNFREFGAGRADDFSLLTSVGTSDRNATLDDNATNLLGDDVSTLSTAEGVFGDATSGFVCLTFVGTGLDVFNNSTTVPTDPYTIIVDGVTVNAAFTGWTLGINKIVSGLPYGSHVVKLTRNSGANSPVFRDFIVYQPKTPTLPTGAKAIGAYNILANFVANATANVNNISTGTVRKGHDREIVYVNGTGGSTDWAFGGISPTTDINGRNLNTNRQNAFFEYVFFGTGFDLRWTGSSSASANIQVSLQDLSNNGSLVNMTTANFPTMANSVYGTGIAFNSGTGILDQLDAAPSNGNGFITQSLPLGLYKVRFLNNTASAFILVNTLDIITPIHSYKQNLYADLQNTLPVGNQGIEDPRKISSLEQITAQKAWSQALGITSSPSTTSTIYVPIPDMSVTHFNRSGRIKIAYHVALNTGTGDCQVVAFVNGFQVGKATYQIASSNTTVADMITVPVSPGFNKIDLYWLTGSGTVAGITTMRSLFVEEA